MKNDRDVVLASIFTFLTVTLWIFFELVKTVKTTTVASSVNEAIVPFDPKIDTDVFSMLVNRKIY